MFTEADCNQFENSTTDVAAEISMRFNSVYYHNSVGSQRCLGKESVDTNFAQSKASRVHLCLETYTCRFRRQAIFSQHSNLSFCGGSSMTTHSRNNIRTQRCAT